MKKILSLFLLFSLFITSSLNIKASSLISDVSEIQDEIIEDTIDEEYNDVYLDSTDGDIRILQEEINFDDDFEDDSLYIVIKNEYSLEFKEYTVDDFKEVDAIGIERSQVNIDYENKVKEKLKLDKKSIVDESLAKLDITRFNQEFKIKLPTHDKNNVINSIDELNDRDDILFVEPNFINEIGYDTVVYPDDKYISKQWAIDKIDLPEAWCITTGSKNIKVGVVDTGIKAKHSDLKSNVNIELKYPTNVELTDNDGHGTKAAGIIGAKGNNDNGITGVCWDVDLINLNYMAEGGNTRAISNAIQYATINNLDILNCSIWCNNTPALYNAVSRFKGIIVCSAGNYDSNNDISPHYPSSYDFDNIISVAATNQNDELAYFYTNEEGQVVASNFGKKTVDLAAPGKDIYTTSNSDEKSKYYEYFQGTSAATPFVTGVAALLKSKYPRIENSRIKSAICNSVDKVDSLKNKVNSGGRLNARKALSTVANHTYTIEYSCNGGLGSMPNTTIIYGVDSNLKKNTFTPPTEQEEFIGWYAHRNSDNKWFYSRGKNEQGWYLEGMQPEGYTKYLYKDEDVVAYTSHKNKDKVTMYAQWKSIEFNVNFSGNGGAGNMDSVMLEINKTLSVPKCGFCKEDSCFNGWYLVNGKGELYCTNGVENEWIAINDIPLEYSVIKYYYNDEFAITDKKEERNLTFVAQWLPKSAIKIGDVDLDGVLTISDATLIQKYGVQIITLNDVQLYAADVDNDSNVNICDATELQKRLTL